MSGLINVLEYRHAGPHDCLAAETVSLYTLLRPEGHPYTKDRTLPPAT